MKIHEIVTEANLLGTALGAGAKALGLGAKAAPEVAPEVAKGVQQVVKRRSKDAAQSGDSWIEKGAEKARKAQKDKYKAVQRSQMAAVAVKHYGEETISLFKTLNLIDIAVEYTYEFFKLQKERATIGEEEYSRRLAELNGKKLLQWLAPKIATGIANKASFMVKWIPAIAQWAKFPATAQLMRTIPAVVTSGAFTAFFASPAGRKWTEDTFSGLITGLGNIPAFLTDFMSAVGEGVKVGKELWDKIDPSGKEQGGKPSNDNGIGGTSTGPVTNTGTPGKSNQSTANLPKDEYGEPIKTKGWEQGNFSLGNLPR